MMRIGQVRGQVPGTEKVRAKLLEVLVETGQTVARDLARASIPPSREAGEGAVRADILAIYHGPPQVAAALEASNPGRGKAWMAAAMAGAGANKLERMLQGTPLAGVPVVQRPSASRHAAFLAAGHRAPRRPWAVVSRKAALDEFLRGQLARVGSAREGWNEAAQELGGSGLASWTRVQGDRGRGSVEVSGPRVRVTVENKVAHARFALPAGALEAAVASGQERARARLTKELVQR